MWQTTGTRGILAYILRWPFKRDRSLYQSSESESIAKAERPAAGLPGFFIGRPGRTPAFRGIAIDPSLPPRVGGLLPAPRLNAIIGFCSVLAGVGTWPSDLKSAGA